MKHILLLCLLSLAAAQDVRTGKISNRLIVAGLMFGMAFQIMEHQVCGIYYFLWNISVPVILLYLLFQMHVLGAGDVKLFSMIGSMLTMQELLKSMAYSFVAAGVGAFLFLAADKNRWRKLQHAAQYLLDFARTGKPKPYLPPPAAESFSFAFSVPILFGTVYVIFL